MKSISYQSIATKILPIIRGSRTQQALSIELGYKQNQLYRWESGQRSMNWVSFVEFCKLCDIDLRPTLIEYFSYHEPLDDSQTFCKKILMNQSLVSIEKVTGINRNLMSKWLKGESIPSLDQIFSIMDKCHFLLIDFLSSVMDITQVAELNAINEMQKEQREAFSKHPVAHGLITLIELKKCTTVDELIEAGSKIFSIETFECANAIKDLLGSGNLGLVDNQLVILSPQIITSGDKLGGINLRKFWLDQAVKKLDKVGDFGTVNRYGYCVYSINENDDHKLREILHDCFSKIKLLATNSKGDESQLVSRSLNITDIRIF